MKPRSKKEQMLVEYASQLPPLTDVQRVYPKEHIFKKKGYYLKKGLVWCQYCGHEYNVPVSSLQVSLDVGCKDVCPCCGKSIHLEHNLHNHSNEAACYMVITTYKGFQVIRCFWSARNNTRGSATKYTCNEMYQLWIDEKGCETILTKRYARNFSSINWDYGSSFHIGLHNASYSGFVYYDDMFDVTGFNLYPRMKVVPLLKRNGWRNQYAKLKVSVSELMRALIKNNDIEMLAKTGQVNVMTYWMKHGWHKTRNRNDDFFDSIKIANRNGYIVKDASLWYDMLDAQRYLGLDTHNAHYVCPGDLVAAHDLYIRRMERVKLKQEKEQFVKEHERAEKSFVRNKGCYLGVCFGNENMTISVLQSVEDYFVEGQAMHHCVYTNRYYENKDSLILSAKDQNGNRLATIELSLRNYRILQCRAACNQKPDRYDEIVRLVESHAMDFRKAKKLQTAKR